MTEAEWLTSAHPDEMLQFVEDRASERRFRLFCCAFCRRIWDALRPEGRDAIEVVERFVDGDATDAERADAFRALVSAAGATLYSEVDGSCIASIRRRFWVTAPVAAAIMSEGEIIGNAQTGKCVYGIPVGSSGSSSGKSPRATFVIESASGTAAYLAQQARDAGWGPIGCAWKYLSGTVGQILEDFWRPRFQPDDDWVREWARQRGMIRDLFGNPFRPVIADPAWVTSTVVALARGIYDDRAFDRLPILADALEDAGCDQPDLLAHCRDPELAHVRGCWAVDLLLGRS